MKKHVLCVIMIIFFISICYTGLRAGVPDEKETLYYSIIAYNGKEYSETFCSNISDTIYLLSDTNNFLTLHQSLLYKWDIAERFYLDYKKLNIPVILSVPGAVEIYKNDSLYEKIEPTFYVYYNDVDEYSDVNWRVFKGEEAKKRYQQYIETAAEYNARLKRYEKTLTEFKEDYGRKVQMIQDLYNRGRQQEAESLMEKVIAESKRGYPVKPEPPKVRVPNPQIGYVIDLPEGLYSILYRTEEGTVLQESEKNLRVFSMRRKDSIGYKVIPEDKWTKPITLSNPGQVLYVNRESDLFFQPKVENEYPELFINRLLDNQAQGNKHIWSWTIVKSVHEGTIEVSSAPGFKSKEVISESPYFVQKSQDKRLGYTIIDYNLIDSEEENVTPSFFGFRINKDVMDRRTLYLRYTSGDTSSGKGSVYIIKPLDAKRLPYWIIAIVMIPIIFGTIYIAVRNRRFTEV